MKDCLLKFLSTIIFIQIHILAQRYIHFSVPQFIKYFPQFHSLSVIFGRILYQMGNFIVRTVRHPAEMLSRIHPLQADFCSAWAKPDLQFLLGILALGTTTRCVLTVNIDVGLVWFPSSIFPASFLVY